MEIKAIKKAHVLWLNNNKKPIYMAIGFSLFVSFAVYFATYNDTYINERYTQAENLENITWLFLAALFISSITIMFNFFTLWLRLFTNKNISYKTTAAILISLVLYAGFAIVDFWNFRSGIQGGFHSSYYLSNLLKDTKCENTSVSLSYINDKAVFRCDGMFWPSYSEIILDKNSTIKEIEKITK